MLFDTEQDEFGGLEIVNLDKQILQFVRARVHGKGSSAPASYTAKSVILDIADNWGHANLLGIRSIEFYLNSTLIELGIYPIRIYGYETDAWNSDTEAETAFIYNNSKTGSYINTQYYAGYGDVTNQRIACVMRDTDNIEFDSIVVNNAHVSGGTTNSGAKNVKIYISTDEITNATYGATITNSTKIFDGQLNQHIAQDVEDPQTLELI